MSSENKPQEKRKHLRGDIRLHKRITREPILDPLNLDPGDYMQVDIKMNLVEFDKLYEILDHLTSNVTLGKGRHACNPGSGDLLEITQTGGSSRVTLQMILEADKDYDAIISHEHVTAYKQGSPYLFHVADFK